MVDKDSINTAVIKCTFQDTFHYLLKLLDRYELNVSSFIGRKGDTILHMLIEHHRYDYYFFSKQNEEKNFFNLSKELLA